MAAGIAQVFAGVSRYHASEAEDFGALGLLITFSLSFYCSRLHGLASTPVGFSSEGLRARAALGFVRAFPPKTQADCSDVIGLTFGEALTACSLRSNTVAALERRLEVTPAN